MPDHLVWHSQVFRQYGILHRLLEALMILGQLAQYAPGKVIAARVPNMANRNPLAGDLHGRQRGPHERLTESVHGKPQEGLLRELKTSSKWSPCTTSLPEGIDGHSTGNIPMIPTTDSVCDRKKPHCLIHKTGIFIP